MRKLEAVASTLNIHKLKALLSVAEAMEMDEQYNIANARFLLFGTDANFLTEYDIEDIKYYVSCLARKGRVEKQIADYNSFTKIETEFAVEKAERRLEEIEAERAADEADELAEAEAECKS